MTQFAERIEKQIQAKKSYLVAGFDPVLSAFPQFVVTKAAASSKNDEEFAFAALTSYFCTAIEAAGGNIAAVKPNIAFFEQYGLGGLRAFVYICSAVRNAGISLIVDAKRGDIGSTAQAYAAAFLGNATAADRKFRLVESDALTVNPFLGFDTLEPFLDACKSSGSGLFVLVKTSNPGSSDIQGFANSAGITVSDRVCEWIRNNERELRGTGAVSGLGAVVGATYPEEARKIRAALPASLFLVPGFGAQGGTAADALSGAKLDSAAKFELGCNPGGVLVNASRGVFQGTAANEEEFKALISANTVRLSTELLEGAKQCVR